jgi:hypothetical protein
LDEIKLSDENVDDEKNAEKEVLPCSFWAFVVK